MIILVVASVLRIIGLDRTSLWVDELFTAVESNPNLSLGELKQSIITGDPHPPLYFVIVYLFFKVFGYTSFVLRLVSALMGIVGVYSVYLLGREMNGRKTGIYAAILTAVNYFAIYYSQEGRMYEMLFLTTTLAFLYLIRFIKNPSKKALFIYIVFSLLMIYSHLVAIFTLVGQYFIILYFIVKPYRCTRKKMTIFAVVSGIVTLLFYIPVIGIIMRNSGRASVWIPMPEWNVFAHYFRDFFGSSEMVIVAVAGLLLYYCLNLMKSDRAERYSVNPEEDKLVFGAIVFFSWISASIIFPWIYSYIKLPILVNRYFINLVPAVLTMAAIGLVQIRNVVIRHAIVSAIVVFSLADLVFVKRFYHNHDKTQFREVSEFILANNTQKEPVISRLGYYFPFYLSNGKADLTVVEKPLDQLVLEMMQDSTKIRPFWYADGHGNPYNLNTDQDDFLKQKFTVENELILYDAWTRHYIPGKHEKRIDISMFFPLKPENGDKIRCFVEKFDSSQSTIEVAGWGFLTEQPSLQSKITVLLIKGTKVQPLEMSNSLREDVTSSLGEGRFDLDNSGFSGKMDVAKLEAGIYEIGLFIENSQSGKRGLVLVGKSFEKK